MKLLILFFLITSFSLSCTRSPPYENAGYSILNKHIQTMKKESWIAQSIGGSFYDGDIKKLNVSFIVYSENFDVDILRSHMVKGIEIFLTSINTNDQLIPYLNHSPFTDKDIDYGISLYTKEGKCLGFAFIVKGNLYYFKNDPSLSVREKGSEEVHEEPYSEALQKVKAGLIAPILPFSSEAL